MPYPRAHVYLLCLLPLVGLAFWPGYFSRLGEVSFAIHLHGATATLWILMLVAQSWAIHGRRVSLHRAAGRSSFVLVPLFLAGNFLVLHSMAVHFASGMHDFYGVFGPGLGALDLVAALLFAGFYHAALRNRRQVQLHARYMLATLFMLATPVVTRVLNLYVPGLMVRGPEDLHLFAIGIHLGNAIGIAFSALLYAAAPRFGWPFLVAAVVLAFNSIAFQWIGPASWWREVFAMLGSVPVHALGVFGFGLGLLAVWHGLRRARSGPGRRAPADVLAR